MENPLDHRSKVYPSSSHVASLDYNHFDQSLLVRFKDGSTYKYHEVPHEVFELVARAPSTGAALSEHIKGSYAYDKIS